MWDMNNCVQQGFNLRNVRQIMLETDEELISRDEYLQRVSIEYLDSQVQQIEEYQMPLEVLMNSLLL
ncbi:hypothetical protein TTHERM_00753480 (macronuclear) [Tetrahymena thermophila SB210]|uniref:Uncharacterized protein n=1 Tax=Tetrahymena thermophila (strain SB210) TaxID=312017 RepID=Q23NH2_TETTS|nr:hypothetical protein TTHERM_00753480 [Tetrahymena thermophila SB210]EAR98102.1 hypothetical protein TTHERM_00753480 [Tetrahymena thermophila SB210]|eukprot:XP_001018347.1 hypothetical protein TTHERM_00753480 [Tetrahymena thermophila SB210]